ncbi:M23 family metallopeptidase [Clostridium cochlearium]|uniref:M23 family metallopeptidase n=1 Tax=Clostridium cochlearium TaxID=1494 RepID=UPI001EDE0D38|nr:M23 family metallopeptidase [Clostridium cochlearium]MBV1818331.1 M23 family metallopeptidase [Bacteroidales bacterium MSK.15.36]MCG4571499.1 M23 family metallopeptidase [Clostridium cochlearium]MCG4579891.1 M23 family metallopeptidase [Clostridium cochlearium]
MGKKFSSKFRIKKEGFYLVLFMCLCLIGSAAYISSKNNKEAKRLAVKEENKIQESNENKEQETVETREPSVEYDNALQVKEEDKKVEEKTEKVAQVSAKTDNKFVKPVEGTIARDYSEEPVYWKSTNSYRPNFGIDIKCELGKPVVAVLDGKIEDIKKDTVDGVQVTINHQNGLKTIYANLDEKLDVKVGDEVKKGSNLGKVGKTTLRAAYENYGEHLHFSVTKDGDYVNPNKYIKY